MLFPLVAADKVGYFINWLISISELSDAVLGADYKFDRPFFIMILSSRSSALFFNNFLISQKLLMTEAQN